METPLWGWRVGVGGAVIDSFPSGLGREFLKWPHVSLAVGELQIQEADTPTRETTHPSKNENQAKIPGNVKCHLVADAGIETEIDIALCQSKLFPLSSTPGPS